jgi:hypothetical protein
MNGINALIKETSGPGAVAHMSNPRRLREEDPKFKVRLD